eukprot:COSAG01_NODE_14_length_41020_cov_40.702133_29_plen_158_part_00
MQKKKFLSFLILFFLLFTSLKALDLGFYMGYMFLSSNKNMSNGFESGLAAHHPLYKDYYYGGHLGLSQTFKTVNNKSFTYRKTHYLPRISLYIQKNPFNQRQLQNIWFGLGLTYDENDLALPLLNSHYFFYINDDYFANIGFQLSKDISLYFTIFPF